MPVRRTQTTAVVTGGRLYVIGGVVDEAEAGRVDVYDPTDGRWRTVAPLPTGLNHTSAVAHEGRIHTFGGYTGSFLGSPPVEDHWVYDPDADRWTAGSPLTTPRGALVAATVDGTAYAIGGADAEGTTAVVEAYDLAADEWTDAAAMPTAREHLAAGAIGDRVYVAGGRQGLSPMVDATERYEPGADGWAARAPMPTARAGIAGDVLAGRLFVFGGEAVGERVFEAVEAYDPATDAWQSVDPLPTPRWGLGVATLDGVIHTVGGGAVPSADITAAHEVLALD